MGRGATWDRRRLLIAAGSISLGGFSGGPPRPESFGRTAAGLPATKVTLTNDAGYSVTLTDLGAAVVGLHTPDREGRFADIVLGLDDGGAYEANDASLGATVGRYANRIANGRFSLDGRSFALDRNLGDHTLHGGARGFSKHLWRTEPFVDAEGQGVRYHLTSPDGDQGFPGALSVTTTYQLTRRNRLLITYRATTDRPTVVNLTNHAYWNLSGDLGSSIGDHRLRLFAGRYTPAIEGIPTGAVASVEGTALDFRQSRELGAAVDSDDPLIHSRSGLDHNLMVDGPSGHLRPVGRVDHPGSGRALEIWSTEPGVQVYSSNFLRGLHGKGVDYGPRMGLCLEPQHFPDSPNQPGFPSTRLNPGDVFQSRTEWRFPDAATADTTENT